MTTSTADVEAIARMLHERRYGQWYDGPCTQTDHQRECLADATAILSYLASRREAQEPVQITMQDVRLMAGEGPLTAKDTLAAVNAHLRRLHRHTAPPAPAGEIERLRAALRIARGYVEDDAKREPSEYDPHEDLKRIDAALNGGRP